MKILTIVGARPQFIKAATISRVVKNMKGVEEIIVHTGQHFDAMMSDVFFDEMQIPKPKYHFAIHGLSHGAMTGQMMEKIEEVILKEKPDWVLVYGDTNSTLAGALAASKLHVKVAHVEAGLRSFNMRMPEEQNRILTDRISTVLFCPTTEAMDNLDKEGYKNFKIDRVNIGDVMFDAAKFYATFSSEKSKAKIPKDKFVLVTVHRAENTDDLKRLGSIVEALNEVAKTHKIVFPVHPRTRKVMEKNNIRPMFDMIDPVGYFEMIEFLKHCELVMSDSGGLQKEAYFFQKACVTLRDETEWVELVKNKVNLLAGADKDKIVNAFQFFTKDSTHFPEGLYGDAHAADKIVQYLVDHA